jgi:asparagine synthase (glutamine-hydrolysing)
MAPAHRYVRWFGQFLPDERHNLYTPAFRSTIASSDPEALFAEVFHQSDAEDCTDVVLDADVNLYLADDLLVKMDRATMAHSLEARSPFLDHQLMEFVSTLPVHFKLSGIHKKRLLKAILRGLVPDTVLDRPKMGFSVPLAQWFREDLREMAYDLLLSPRTLQRGYFEPTAVAKLLNAHCRRHGEHGQQLWDLLVLELWHRTFSDGAIRLASSHEA